MAILGCLQALGGRVDRLRLELLVQGELLDQGGRQFRVVVDDQDAACVGHGLPPETRRRYGGIARSRAFEEKEQAPSASLMGIGQRATRPEPDCPACDGSHPAGPCRLGRSPARPPSSRSVRASGGTRTRRDQGKQARGRWGDAQRPLPAQTGVVASRPRRAPGGLPADPPHYTQRRLVRGSGRPALQPTDSPNTRTGGRPLVAHRSSLRHPDRTRPQYPAARLRSRQRDFHPPGPSRICSDRRMHRARSPRIEVAPRPSSDKY